MSNHTFPKVGFGTLPQLDKNPDNLIFILGRKRLEPIAVIILSVIMASVSVQIMVEAVQTIYNMAAKGQGPPEMSNLTISLVASTIGKFELQLFKRLLNTIRLVID